MGGLQLTGRRYHIVEYFGHPEAEHVILLMGSGASTARETIEYMAQHENAKVCRYERESEGRMGRTSAEARAIVGTVSQTGGGEEEEEGSRLGHPASRWC